MTLLIRDTKMILTNKFKMKDLGIVGVILIIKITIISNGLIL